MTKTEKQNNQTPSNGQIKEQLRHILSSQLFSKAAKLSDFLEYVVTETLDGRAGRIKGFTIASDVFGRNESNVSDVSTIVRVEAGRLRRRLIDYYNDEGKNTSICIEIPKGTYVPIFGFTESYSSKQFVAGSDNTNDQNKAQQLNSEKLTSKNNNHRKIKQSIILLLFLLTIFTSFWQLDLKTLTLEKTTDHDISQLDINLSDRPSIMVFPFESHMANPSGKVLTNGFTEDIITDLSKLPGLDVIALSSILSLKDSMNDYMQVARRLDVKYILRGSFRDDGQSDNIRITAQLYDSLNDHQLWAERFEIRKSAPYRNRDEVSSQIIQGIAQSLTGITRQAKQSTHLENREAYELYKQAMNLLNPPADSWRMIAARRAFERVIKLDSKWAGGYAGVAYTYAFNVWWGHSKEPEEELKKAFAFANKALALDNSFGLANSALAFAHLSQRNFDKALLHSKIAIKSRPSDPYVLAFHGFILCANGDAKTGLAFAQRSLRIDPFFARTPFLNILAVINFHIGNYHKTLELFERNIKRGGPIHSGTQSHQVAALVKLGRMKEAGNIYNLMKLHREDFNYIKWLKRSFKMEEDANKVLIELQKIAKIEP
ncbi:MAG: hypothetical protein IME94_02790 [Proteobacteria bacterium]|nr:hypothetical protein [Pseudomonadota bacterium]